MTALDKVGEFFVRNLRDKALDHIQQLLNGKLRTPAVLPLQSELEALPDSQKDVLVRTVTRLLDTALHDLLVALQESHDLEQGIELLVDESNAAGLSGMLHGEIFGPDGWIARYSEHPSGEDMPQG